MWESTLMVSKSHLKNLDKKSVSVVTVDVKISIVCVSLLVTSVPSNAYVKIAKIMILLKAIKVV